MRQMAWLSMAVLLGACIPIYVPTGRSSSSGTRVLSDGVRVVGAAVGVALLVKQIRDALSRVRAGIPARRAQLHPIRCGSGDCYDPEEVAAVVAAIRRDAEAAFPREALASQISLDEEIVEASTLGEPGPQASIRLVRFSAEGPSPSYTASSVDRILGRIAERIDSYVAHDQLNPTIHIVSVPDRASLVMQIGGNAGTRREGKTNNEIQSVWRGRYTGEVSKPGYRGVKGFSIDLMNDRRTKVGCKLVGIKADSSEESSCWLE